MSSLSLLIVLATALPGAEQEHPQWTMFTSKDGNFVVDLPGKPTKSFTKTSRSGRGQVKVIVTQCDTPDVLYTAQKIALPAPIGLKSADIDAVLEFWRDNLASEFNGKVTNQKKLRLDTGAHGLDYTLEGRPDPKAGLATIRVREYLSQKDLFILVASTAADRDLPEDVGHFFASFSVGTKRIKKVGPHPEPDGKPLGDWGLAIDPDSDCKIDEQGKALAISVPATHHDLNADNDKLNAPRVMREVTGDFSITVKVGGSFKPTAKSTNPKAVPYEGAGILVWQDSDNYIFLGRAAIQRSNKTSEFAAFEEREWGARAAVNNHGLNGGPVYLRLERKGNRLLGSTSKDGKTWEKLDPMETSYPATIKVGLYAINGCTDPFSARFEDFKFTEGSTRSTTKKKR